MQTKKSARPTTTDNLLFIQAWAARGLLAERRAAGKGNIYYHQFAELLQVDRNRSIQILNVMVKIDASLGSYQHAGDVVSKATGIPGQGFDKAVAAAESEVIAHG